MLSLMWLIWGVGVVVMVLGVALVSSRRPPLHTRWGIVLFCLGFAVMVTATCSILVAPMR